MSAIREERRADRLADRQADRDDRRMELDARLQEKEFAAEQARKDAEAKRRQELADKKQRDAARAAKKAAAAAKRARLARWIKRNPSTLFVAFVMVASIVPAVISQVGALSGAKVPVLLAGLLAAMLEGGAWAITFMGKAAQDAGREPRKYRLGTWLTASAAAVVNLWHGLQEYPSTPWVAFVLGGSSLFAIYIWDLKTHGSHGKTRAQKKADKERKAHEKARRKHHAKIADQADRLVSAMPFGALTGEQAFAAAWRIANGSAAPMSPVLYAAATDSATQLGAAFELKENVRPELLESGLKAASLDPFRDLVSKDAQALESQAGIGPSALQGSPTDGRVEGVAAPVPGRSDEELKELLPDALAAAAQLVAEGKQISAAGLSKSLQIRREDAMRLRDIVIAERKANAA